MNWINSFAQYFWAPRIPSVQLAKNAKPRTYWENRNKIRYQQRTKIANTANKLFSVAPVYYFFVVCLYLVQLFFVLTGFLWFLRFRFDRLRFHSMHIIIVYSVCNVNYNVDVTFFYERKWLILDSYYCSFHYYYCCCFFSRLSFLFLTLFQFFHFTYYVVTINIFLYFSVFISLSIFFRSPILVLLGFVSAFISPHS